ncbi:MAG: class I SAM-dependent methyltransferase [Acidobacteria bacterium]|nr:class I SAM-dependent methyltransferase [Acidobacteriota bacterium]
MGLYAKHVLPRLLDLALRNKEATRLRREWIHRARGQVLEVGVGSGLNLAFYSEEVQHLLGVDPSRELLQMAQQRARLARFKIDLLARSAEDRLPLADATIDSAVLTWTLCSIADPRRALLEVKRLLKPEGRVIFIEHGRSPDSKVARWQDRLTPLWKHIAGGCTLNRQMVDVITAAGFRIEELATEYIPGPRPMTYTFKGVAVRK